MAVDDQEWGRFHSETLQFLDYYIVQIFFVECAQIAGQLHVRRTQFIAVYGIVRKHLRENYRKHFLLSSDW